MSVHITDLPRMRRETVQGVRRTSMQAVGIDPQAYRDMQNHARVFEAAELYWVTKDMTQVALDASRDMPPWTISEFIPTPIGIVVYDGELPPLPDMNSDGTGAFGQPKQEMATPSWFAWHQVGGDFYVHYGRFAQDGDIDPLHNLGIIDLKGVANRVTFTMGEETPAEWMLHRTAPFYLLGATWAMMRQVNVASTRTDMIGEKRKTGRPPVRPTKVTTVTLRRMKHVDVRVSESGRVYIHRWVVRGHWRQQAHGPQMSLKTPLWIPHYIKGPDGAPLLAREKIMVWRR